MRRRVQVAGWKRGVGKGERVLFWAANGPEWVAAFFGCALRGVIVVPLDVESAPDFVARVQEQTQGRLLLLSGETKKAAAVGSPSHAAVGGLASLSAASGPASLSGANFPPTLSLEELDAALARHSAEPYAHENIGVKTSSRHSLRDDARRAGWCCRPAT